MEFPVTSGSFDPAFGEAGGLWVGSATGLQSWDLASGALRRYGRVEVRPWSDNRGLRALELLSYLAAAEDLTGDAKYAEASAALRTAHGYDQMMVNAKITDPCDDNHSDDEEAFLPLYTYAMAYRRLGRALEPPFLATARRFCRETEPESASLYLAICAVIFGGEPDPRILEDLRGWPLDLIDW